MNKITSERILSDSRIIINQIAIVKKYLTVRLEENQVQSHVAKYFLRWTTI